MDTFTATAPAEMPVLTVSTSPKSMQLSTYRLEALATKPLRIAFDSEVTTRTAPLTPTPTKPPPAVTEISRMVEFSRAGIPRASICLLLPLLETRLFRSEWVFKGCALAPTQDFTSMSPPALRTAPVSTRALTLELRTETVRPTPTPAPPPPTATEPEIMLAFRLSLASTRMFSAAVTRELPPIMAEVASESSGSF